VRGPGRFALAGDRTSFNTLEFVTMPFAQVFMIEGRSDDQKRAVIEKVSQALVEAVNAPPETVRVWITEVPKTQWGIAGKTAKDLGR
jgi:4-oxalocrotonate tautomerase